MDNIKDFDAETETANQMEFAVEDHNTCCLCGSELKFQHRIDYLTLEVKEESHCPSCRIQMRSRDYVLQ